MPAWLHTKKHQGRSIPGVLTTWTFLIAFILKMIAYFLRTLYKKKYVSHILHKSTDQVKIMTLEDCLKKVGGVFVN